MPLPAGDSHVDRLWFAGAYHDARLTGCKSPLILHESCRFVPYD